MYLHHVHMFWKQEYLSNKEIMQYLKCILYSQTLYGCKLQYSRTSIYRTYEKCMVQ